MTEDPDFSGAATPNTRMRAIRRYLAKPHRRADCLMLQVSGEEDVHVLKQWGKDEIKPEIALEIDEILTDHVAEVNSVVSAALITTDKDGKQLSVKPLQYSPQARLTATDTLFSDPKDLTGDARSLVVQAQRHTEISQRMHAQSQFQTMQLLKQITDHMADLTEMMATRIVESEHRARKESQRAEELENELATIVSEQSTDEAAAAAQSKIVKIMEPLLPIIMQQLMARLSSGGGMPPQSGGTGR